MSYLDTKINYYPSSVYQTTPIGTCTLSQMLQAINQPKEEMLTLFKQIEEASKVGDKKVKDELKSKLYYFSPCCFTDGLGRKYNNIVSFTGLAVLDFDNLTEQEAIDLKEWLFNEYKFVIASFLSSSKKGVKVLCRIPEVKSVEEFKAVFYGMAVTMQWIKGFDGSSQNCMLPNYLTYDYDLLMREDAVIFDGAGYKEQEFPKVSDVSSQKKDIIGTEDDRACILLQLTRMFNSITDVGHRTVVSASLLAGGWVSAGYYTTDEMQEILFDLIDATPYLQSKPQVYKRTATEMMGRGMLAPLYVKRHRDEN